MTDAVTQLCDKLCAETDIKCSHVLMSFYRH